MGGCQIPCSVAFLYILCSSLSLFLSRWFLETSTSCRDICAYICACLTVHLFAGRLLWWAFWKSLNVILGNLQNIIINMSADPMQDDTFIGESVPQRRYRCHETSQCYW